MKKQISFILIGLLVPCICMGQSAKYTALVRQKQTKMAELQKCMGTNENLKIAGLSMVGLTVAGIAGNIAEAKTLQEYENKIDKTDEKIIKTQQDIDNKKVEAQKLEERKQQQLKESNGLENVVARDINAIIASYGVVGSQAVSHGYYPEQLPSDLFERFKSAMVGYLNACRGLINNNSGITNVSIDQITVNTWNTKTAIPSMAHDTILENLNPNLLAECRVQSCNIRTHDFDGKTCTLKPGVQIVQEQPQEQSEQKQPIQQQQKQQQPKQQQPKMEKKSPLAPVATIVAEPDKTKPDEYCAGITQDNADFACCAEITAGNADGFKEDGKCKCKTGSGWQDNKCKVGVNEDVEEILALIEENEKTTANSVATSITLFGGIELRNTDEGKVLAEAYAESQGMILTFKSVKKNTLVYTDGTGQDFKFRFKNLYSDSSDVDNVRIAVCHIYGGSIQGDKNVSIVNADDTIKTNPRRCRIGMQGDELTALCLKMNSTISKVRFGEQAITGSGDRNRSCFFVGN